MNHDHAHDMLVTMVTAIVAGVILIVMARRTRVPAIVLLLLGGVGLGPMGLGVFDPGSLGDGLTVLVSLAIALILFEGGLTLDLKGYRSASGVIKRLLTVGVLTTWLVTAAAIWLIVGIELPYAVLAGSLVIVTGPTVIAPLLKRIKVTPRIHSILHWEGVLIDPIGVFIAVLCFEWASDVGGPMALTNFALRLVSGMGIGLAGGLVVSWATHRQLVPDEVINIFALACAVLIFGCAEAIASEAGLLSVTVAGFVVGLSKPKQLKQIRQFKAEMTDLLIGTLFILLSARLNFEQFRAFGWSGVVVVLIVLLLVRPLSVFLCTWGSELGRREKLFLSWIAPRGIVAASLASLIQLRLHDLGQMAGDKFVETFTYFVITATIILQGASAGILAKILRLKRPAPTGWLIIGSHALSRSVARFLTRQAGVKVLVVDSNARAIHEARAEGLDALEADARDPALSERVQMDGIGNILALTDNEDFNHLVCQRWHDLMDLPGVYRWKPIADDDAGDAQAAGEVIWSQIPKPSLISAELVSGESSLVTATGDTTTGDAAVMPLLGVSTHGPIDVAPRPDPSLPGQYLAVLGLQRKEDYLLRSLKDKLVVQATAAELPALFESLVDLVLTVVPGLARDETIRELLERESTFPTALGHGVAVPHSYCQTLSRRLCVIAQTPTGVDFKAADQLPVQLVFLVLSPPGDPEGHLATLAEIAKLVIDPDIRHRLIKAQNPLEILKIIHQVKAS